MKTLSFPPQEFCLACQGCCRFQDSRSPWRPKVYAQEEKFFLAAPKFLKPDREGYLEAKCVHGCWLCEHLEEATNRCQVYPYRPLECILYPFLLLRDKNRIVVALHLACPYVQEKKDLKGFQDACENTKQFFEQKNVQAFLRTCQEHITSSHVQSEEVQVIFTVAL